MTTVRVTVDVEGDYGTDVLLGVDRWMPWVMDRFDELGVRATLFVVGDVARRRADRLRDWAARGHELASHGDTHVALTRLDAAAAQGEVRRAKDAVENATGHACAGFRAPFFACPDDLHTMLHREGHLWSSSQAPLSPVAGRAPRRREPAPRPIPEFAVPALGPWPLPDGLSWRRQLHPLARAHDPPSIFYFHPYELLDEVPAYAHPLVWRPLLTRRAGAFARRLLVDVLRAWSESGAQYSTISASLSASAT